jgi:hypothetical protein
MGLSLRPLTCHQPRLQRKHGLHWNMKSSSFPVHVSTQAPSPIPPQGSRCHRSAGESPLPLWPFGKGAPNGTKFAMSEYRYVGSQALQVHIIDPLGLHDPFFAHHGFSTDEFFSMNPDLIWLPHPDYSKINASILDSPEFWREYNYYPSAFDYGFAIRKDSADAIIEEVNKAWRKAYRELEITAYLAHTGK